MWLLLYLGENCLEPANLNYVGNDATHKNTYEFILGLENHDLCKIDTNLDAKIFHRCAACQ